MPIQFKQDKPTHIPPLSLWRNSNFLLLISGQGISSIGTQVSQLALPLLILTLTHSPAQAGLITALRGLPYVLFSLPAGALVDRWNRRRVMILCDVARAITLASIPITFAFNIISLPQLYLVSLIEGSLFVFFHMAQASALPHIVTKEQLPMAASQNEILNSSSVLIGPSIGGILYTISYILPFLTDAISYVISSLSLLFIRVPFQKKRIIEQKALWIEVKDGLNWLWHQHSLRFLALITGCLITSSIGYTLIVIVIAQHQHASALTIGLLFASGGAGSVFGAFLVGPLQKRFSFAAITITSTWIWAFSWLLFAFAYNTWLLGIANGLSYTIVPIYMVSQYSYRLALIPDALQGRVNSVFRLIAFGGQPLGLALTGILLQTINPLPTILLLFAPLLICAVATTLNKDIRITYPH